MASGRPNVYVGIDPTRYHKQPPGVDLPSSTGAGKILIDFDNDTITDSNIAFGASLRRNDHSVADNKFDGLLGLGSDRPRQPQDNDGRKS